MEKIMPEPEKLKDFLIPLVARREEKQLVIERPDGISDKEWVVMINTISEAIALGMKMMAFQRAMEKMLEREPPPPTGGMVN